MSIEPGFCIWNRSEAEEVFDIFDERRQNPRKNIEYILTRVCVEYVKYIKKLTGRSRFQMQNPGSMQVIPA